MRFAILNFEILNNSVTSSAASTQSSKKSKTNMFVPPLLAPYVLPVPEATLKGGHSGLGGKTYHRVLKRRYALLVKEDRFMHRTLKVCKSCGK